MWPLKPDISLAADFIYIHIEVADTETLRLEAPDQRVWPLKTVGLHYDKVAVGIHRLYPAHPLACLPVVDDVRAVKSLRIMEWRKRIDSIWLYDKPQVFPIVEVGGTVCPDAPCPHVGAQSCLLLVLTIPVVNTVFDQYLRCMCLYGLAVGVEPQLPGPDTIIRLCANGQKPNHRQHNEKANLTITNSGFVLGLGS